MFMDNLRKIIKKFLLQNGEVVLSSQVDLLSDNQVIELVTKCLNNLYKED